MHIHMYIYISIYIFICIYVDRLTSASGVSFPDAVCVPTAELMARDFLLQGVGFGAWG